MVIVNFGCEVSRVEMQKCCTMEIQVAQNVVNVLIKHATSLNAYEWLYSISDATSATNLPPSETSTSHSVNML